MSNDIIGSFNVFLEKQKEVEGEATMTLVQFDTEYEVIHENKLLKDVPNLTKDTFVPGGCTALLDAVGTTINNVGRRLFNTPKQNRPDKVIVVILTDGEENSSRKFRKIQIKEMIEHQQKEYSWNFIFLGANQDSFTEATKIGVVSPHIYDYTCSSEGIRSICATLCRVTTNYRTAVCC